MTVAITTPVRTNESKRVMRQNVRRHERPIKKATIGSASLRLHELYGDSPATWQNRMFGATSDYRQVERMNGVLRDLGLDDKVSELMVPIFASVGPRNVPHWSEVIHLHNTSDAYEDVVQAELIKDASDENLNRYIGQLANDIRVGENLLAALEAERQRRRA